MNKKEKAKYDFRAIKETIKDNVILHKDIVLEISKSLELRHLKLLEDKDKLQSKLDKISEVNEHFDTSHMTCNELERVAELQEKIKSILGDEKNE